MWQSCVKEPRLSASQRIQDHLGATWSKGALNFHSGKQQLGRARPVASCALCTLICLVSGGFQGFVSDHPYMATAETVRPRPIPWTNTAFIPMIQTFVRDMILIHIFSISFPYPFSIPKNDQKWRDVPVTLYHQWPFQEPIGGTYHI